MAHVASVNVGVPRTVTWRGREVTTAIWKDPVHGPVRFEGVNAEGDDQADRRVHGGPDKAVYAYSTEDYEWWTTEAPGLEPHSFGENLTTSGLDLSAAVIGDRWRIGSVVLEVAQPREPCFKLGIRTGDDSFPGRFERARRPGAYLRIIEAGTITAGDTITVEPAAEPAIPLRTLVDGDADPELLARIVDDDRVPSGWRRSAARALGR